MGDSAAAGIRAHPTHQEPRRKRRSFGWWRTPLISGGFNQLMHDIPEDVVG